MIIHSKCPHCGSDKGYYYNVRCLDHRVGVWGEESESGEIVVVGQWPRTVVCMDCGRRTPIEEADRH